MMVIDESAFYKHFNVRKETLQKWHNKVGFSSSPFKGFKMPDPRLYVEHSEFLDEMVDIIITNERHIFLRGPIGIGKSTLMLLALRDLPNLTDRRGREFIVGYVGMTGLYEKQMAAAIANALKIKYKRSWESQQIIDEIAKVTLKRYIEENKRSVLFIEDVADNQENSFHKLRYLADLPSQEMVDEYHIDEPIITLVMSGTPEYWSAMVNFLPQIADRTEPLDVPPMSLEQTREFIGRRIYYAKGIIDQFDPTDYDLYPFEVEAVDILHDSAKGVPRDIRMLGRACEQLAAENYKNTGDPIITEKIAELVAEAYQSIFEEVK